MAAVEESFFKLSSSAVPFSVHLLMLSTLPCLTFLQFGLSSASHFNRGKKLTYKMNRLPQTHLYGQSREDVWMVEEMGCAGNRRGVKDSNYYPIDFHWCGGENKCFSVNVHSTWQ